MKTASKLQRLGAAIASVTVTLSIVWAISGYAYPDVSAYWFGTLAKTTLLHTHS